LEDVIMFKHLLVATDGSALSESAAQMAVGLAKENNATVTGIYMVRPFHMTIYSAEMVGYTEDEFLASDRARAEEYLTTVRNIAAHAGVECDTVAASGAHPYEAILDTAKERNCDLIVMASHGHGGIRGLLIGSETQKVLTHSHLPVLVVRPPV
jgi:nucleotide-binding universal stress UspA family protein